MSFADLKAQARQAVHDTLAVPAFYEGVPITVRHHTRSLVHGDIGGEYASIQEGINRLVFDRNALADAGVTLVRGGVVTIPVYGLALELDQPEAEDGPVTAHWQVVAQ